jgi:dsRNA-specific ribonuclease
MTTNPISLLSERAKEEFGKGIKLTSTKEVGPNNKTTYTAKIEFANGTTFSADGDSISEATDKAAMAALELLYDVHEL